MYSKASAAQALVLAVVQQAVALINNMPAQQGLRSIAVQHQALNPAPQLLIIAPSASYRTGPFISAAKRLGMQVIIASQSKNSLINQQAKGVHIDLDDADSALLTLLKSAQEHRFSGVIGTDDNTTELAAKVAKTLGLAHNDPAATQIARRKDLARQCLRDAPVLVPAFRRIALTQALAPQLAGLVYPCVLKPLALAASRGVIRVDNEQQFYQASARIQAIVQSHSEAEERDHILVEQFIPGFEVAVEAMLNAGKLNILTIFDKPDPLDGPFFEETYYITPSRLTAEIQRQIAHSISIACQSYGLREGPVHAECRINQQGVWIIELAARTIGGLCGRLLRFGTGFSLEELVIAQACRQNLDMRSSSGAAGVLMIPTPQAGILRRIEGILAASKIEFIDDVDIQVRSGYELIPLPEGSSYLGFIFARAPTAEQAENALRKAHAQLRIIVAPLWKASIA